MNIFKLLPVVCSLVNGFAAHAQNIYVDPVTGNDSFSGTNEKPVLTISQAIVLAHAFDGKQPIHIKLFPGLYLLQKQVVIDSLPVPDDTSLLSIEAIILPGDTAWRPSLMPVIQSVSDNNKDYGHFNHCIGFQVERSHVAFCGLKFTGNAHPAVRYYYPIERHKPYLHKLDISFCLFAGAPHAAPLQGAVFAQGPGISVDRCTFYNCRNAILCFTNVKGFSLTHNILYGAEEAAIRLGYGSDGDLPFVFHHNIIASSAYAWLGYKTAHHYYTFEDAVFTGNQHYIGYNTDPEELDKKSKVTELRVEHQGAIIFDSDLILMPASAGYNLGAGYYH